jgi:hypothetical protein
MRFSPHTLGNLIHRTRLKLAVKVLRGFAEDPFAVLSKEEKAKMTAAHSALLRKFTDLAFDESAEVRWQEAQPTEADNIAVGPVAETDFQGDLIESSGNPFSAWEFFIATKRETCLQEVRPPATTGMGKGERLAGAAPKNHPGRRGVSLSFRRAAQ